MHSLTGQIRIFYAHSSHRESVLNVYEKVVDYYRNNEIVKIMDVDDIPTNNNIFLFNITDTMRMSDFFICDITPDFYPPEQVGKK